MTNDLFQTLGNPAWHALTSVQSDLSTGTELAKRYQPYIVSFAACVTPTLESAASLDPFISNGESFFLIGDLPPLPSNWSLRTELVCSQMIYRSTIETVSGIETTPGVPEIHLLTEDDSADMFDLINTVYPGYYKPDTWRMGAYFGIKQQGQLVAIAGERMRLDGLTELSAICTHPDFTGRQYAQRLITHLMNVNLANGIIPFLHVAQTNKRALRLYKHLGFAHHRTISFWLLKKA